MLITDANVDHLGGLAVLRQHGDHGFVVRSSAVVRKIAAAGYDGRRSEHGAMVAYEIAGRESKDTLLFAPVFAEIDKMFAEIDKTLARAIASASVVFADGSFYSDDELVTQGLAQKRARSLGHLRVGGNGGTLEPLRCTKARMIFTHLNNSNPMLDPGSPAAARVRELGAEIAYDGMELNL